MTTADTLMSTTIVRMYIKDAIGQRQQCLDDRGSGNDVEITVVGTVRRIDT